MKHAVRAALGLLALAAAWHVLALVYVFARRLGYPLDLEWMEGGTLLHALRLAEGKSIYVEPSVEFVPFLYMPLYPALLALLGKGASLSYALGRAVSIACFTAACAIAWRAVRREGGGRAFAAAAVGTIAASFPLVDCFYDLVRVDSLQLALLAGGLYVLRHRHGTAGGVAASAALLGLALWAKQTSVIFIVAGGVALLALDWRRLWIYALVLLVVDGAGMLWLDRATGGWFWRIVYDTHQSHDVYWGRIQYKAQWNMLRAAPLVVAFPLLWLAVAAATRRASLGARYWAFVAIAAIQASAVSFATQWAVRNAYIPGYTFAAVLLGVGGADLFARARALASPRLGAALAVLVALLPALQLAHLVYRPARYAPDTRAFASAKRFIRRLRALAKAGDVLIPYHPYYAVLVGRRPHFHQMGVNDFTRAGDRKLARRIRESLEGGRFASAVLDKEPDPRYGSPMRAWRRERLGGGDSPATLHGFRTRPRFVFRPGAGERVIPRIVPKPPRSRTTIPLRPAPREATKQRRPPPAPTRR